MDNRKNLWGDIPHTDDLRTPYTLLNEQASLLIELTKGVLIGEIERSQYYSDDHSDIRVALGFRALPPSLGTSLKGVRSSGIGSFMEDQQELNRKEQQEPKPISVLYLKIKVPILNNYTISLLKVTYPVELYPAGVFSLVDQIERFCSDEEAFEQGIGEILSSQKVRRIVSALLSDVHVGQPAS
jgi:hypothetical protein